MASPYISNVSGPWNADGVDTWGQGIGVYPNATNDVVTVSTGHTVTYNISSDVVLGRVNIYGTLSFSRYTNTELVIAGKNAAQLFVKDTGFLDVGTSLSPIPAQYLAIISIDTSNRENTSNYYGDYPHQGIVVEYGGRISIVGDSGYYGNIKSADFAATWSSGKTFTVTGDVTAWPIGALLVVTHPWVARLRAYSNPYYSYNDQHEVTIASLQLVNGNTEITINENFPDVNSAPIKHRALVSPWPYVGRIGYPVAILSRNVQIRSFGTLINSELLYGAWGKPHDGGGILIKVRPIQGDGTDYFVDFPNDTITEYRDIVDAEFLYTIVYGGDYKNVTNCSFRHTPRAALFGMVSYNSVVRANNLVDVDGSYVLWDSPPARKCKIVNNIFYNCQGGIYWHRDVGGADGSDATNNLFALTGYNGDYPQETCWGECVDGFHIKNNRYIGCHVIISSSGAWAQRFWSHDHQHVVDDDIEYCGYVSGWHGIYNTVFNGDIDHCLGFLGQCDHVEFNGNITNIISELLSNDTIYNCDTISNVASWQYSGQTGYFGGLTSPVYADSLVEQPFNNTFNGCTMDAHFCLEHGTAHRLPLSTNLEFALPSTKIKYKISTIGAGNIYNDCAISALALFKDISGTGYSCTFNTCNITQKDPSWYSQWSAVRGSYDRATGAAIPSTYAGMCSLGFGASIEPNDDLVVITKYTKVRLLDCTITELVPSQYNRCIFNSPTVGNYTFYPDSMISMYATPTRTTVPMHHYIEINGNGTRTLESLYGTITEVTNDLHQESTTSLKVVGKKCWNLLGGGEDPDWELPTNLQVINITETNVPSGSRTISMYVKGFGWNPALAAGDVYLHVTYPSGVGTTATAQSTQSVGDGWTRLRVTYVSPVAGDVRTKLMLTRADDSSYILVDPALYIGEE